MRFHRFNNMTIILSLLVCSNILPLALAQDGTNSGGSPQNDIECSNQMSNDGCTCQKLSSLCPLNNISAKTKTLIHKSSAYHPFLQDYSNLTGGFTTKGVGELYVNPNVVYNSASFSVHDMGDAQNTTLSFDAKIQEITNEEGRAYLHYRHDSNTVFWFINDATNPAEFRSTSDDLSSTNLPGFLAVVDKNIDGTYKLKLDNGKTRTFNTDGWVVEDKDRNGNTIRYIRDDLNYVKSIALPTVDDSTYEITMQYSTFTFENTPYKRLDSISYPNGKAFHYIYSATDDSNRFTLDRVYITDANNNEITESNRYYAYEDISEASDVMITIYGDHTNTNICKRLKTVTDQNDRIVTKLDYVQEDVLENNIYNRIVDVKKIGDYAGWYLIDDASDYSYDTGNGAKYAETGFVYDSTDGINPGNANIYFAADASQQENIDYIQSSQYTKPENSYTNEHPDADPSRDVQVFKAKEVEYTGAKYNLKTKESHFSSFSYEDPNNRNDTIDQHTNTLIDIIYLQDQGFYNDGGQTIEYDDATMYLWGGRIISIAYETHLGTLRIHFAYDNSFPDLMPLKKIIVDPTVATENRQYYNLIHEYTNDNQGNVLSYKDPLGNTTNFSYTAEGLISSIESPMGRQVQFEYTDIGDISRIIAPGNLATDISYYPKSGLIKSVTSPMGYTTGYQYDEKDRVTGIIDQNQDQVFSIVYDSTNDKVTINDGEGSETVYDYDFIPDEANNRELLKLTVTSDAGSATNNTVINYNPNKTIQSIDFPDYSQTTFHYDSLSRADEIVTTSGAAQSSVTLRMDNLGLPFIIDATDENSNVQRAKFEYNDHDLTISKIYESYDPNVAPNTPNSENNAKTIDFSYDRLLRTNEINKTTGSDQSSQVIQSTAQTYNYDDASQITQTKMGMINNLKADYFYNKDGQLRLIKRGNQTVSIYEYDGNGLLNSLSHKKDVNNDTGYTVENQPDHRSI